MSAPAPGFPTWVDLGTSDLDSATAFYTGLFGWRANVSPDPRYGGYTIFTLDDETVAGAGPLFDPHQPVTWNSYFATADADAAARSVEAAGGKVLSAPFDVGDQGRMAAFLDPSGAAFSVWQPLAMAGADLLDAPGALTWNELTTRDVEGSIGFYGQIFGWTGRSKTLGDTPYVVWEKDQTMVGGMMPMIGDVWPTDLTAHWMVYFAVEDCDDAAARAIELGGLVSVPPTNIPMGRFAVLNDPQGAVFSVLADVPV
jgi:predicted enzyme related to lactoylglutathione lyase